MLQTFTDTRPYSQPLSPLSVDGERYALPVDFVDGLAFLRPFVKRRCKMIENFVHILSGKLYIVTNNLVIDYDIGSTDLPNACLGPNEIRILEAFETPPVEVIFDSKMFHFHWEDGQQFYFGGSGASCVYLSSETHERAANDAFDRFLRFNDSVAITDAVKREIRRMHGGPKMAKDIFLNERAILSRMSSDGETWTSVFTTPFENNADRVMRFDRQAFLGMIKIASEINFATSPVCFRHQHGRGMLVELTTGSDLPDFEEGEND
ncbi:hypothetical protein [Ruegeria faecimaris]|uniref:Uncharacterized protein n=1 Tax=Ruegeria faecimaris TaxID=686389 RepID=A0A521E075_9RHOB|nr:hypothetical protein [Ruegeria faecimaris]SMO77369.1 hypothetical protein SAMN06265380_108123 [Ruegeria faecimaris]